MRIHIHLSVPTEKLPEYVPPRLHGYLPPATASFPTVYDIIVITANRLVHTGLVRRALRQLRGASGVPLLVVAAAGFTDDAVELLSEHNAYFVGSRSPFSDARSELFLVHTATHVKRPSLLEETLSAPSPPDSK